MNVLLKNLEVISINKGKIVKFYNKNEIKKFRSVQEIYFSYVKFNKVKAWKLNKIHNSILTVIVGRAKFVLFDNNFNFLKEIILTDRLPRSIYIPNNIWYGFKGLSRNQSLICSVIDYKHNIKQQKKMELKKFNYKW